MSYYHIQRYLFDVTTNSEVNAKPLQNKLSRVFNQELSVQIEQLFDRVIPADLILQLPQLTIDVGIIPYDLLDNTLVPRIIDALEEQLSELIALNMQAETVDVTMPSFPAIMADLYGLLEYYLLFGLFPWWAKSFRFDSVDDVIEELINRDAPRFKALVLRVGLHAHVQKRLALQLPDNIIKKIIAVLEPDEAEFIFRYQQDVLDLQQKTRLVNEELNTFGKVVWEFVFRLLLTNISGRFNRKMFARSNINAIAAHYNLLYSQLLELLNNALNSYQFEEADFELFNIVEELWTEQEAIEPEPATYIAIERNATAEFSVEIFKEQLDIIHHYLVHASLSVTAKIKDLAELNEILLRLVKAIPGAVKEMLQGVVHLENPGARLADTFNEEAIIQIIRLTEPANADFILEYQAAANKIQERERLVNIEQGAFSKVVWELILNFLFTEHASEFNRRVFLERNIRGIAARYNLKLADFVTTLQQQARLLISSSFLDLFFNALNVISEVVIDPVKNSTEADNDQNASNSKSKQSDKLDNEVASENKSSHADKSVLYRDVLLYLMTEGKMPQWYREALSPEQMLLLLAANTDKYLLQLLAFAEKQESHKLNFIRHLPKATLLKVFAQLKDGRQAVTLHKDVLQLLSQIPELGLSTDFINEITFNSFWQAYSRESWQNFDRVFFIKVLIRQLSFRVSLPERAIFNLIQAENFKAGKSNVKNILAEIRPVRKGYEFAGELLPELSWTEKEWLTNILSEFSQDFFQKAVQSSSVNEAEALAFILEYFLKHNRMPAGLNLSAQQSKALLRYILRILFRKTPEMLKIILGASGNMQARIELHNIFRMDAAPEDAAVTAFLETYLQADIIRYLSTIMELPYGQERDFFWHLVDNLLLNPAGLNDGQKQLLYRISRQQSIARHLAERYSDKQVYQLIGQSPHNWQGNVVTFLSDVTAFFQSVFGTANETFTSRLRAFNIMFFLGSSGKQSPEDYIIKLFDNFSYYLGIMTAAQLEKLIGTDIIQGNVSQQFYSIALLLKAGLKRQLQLLTGRKIFNKITEETELMTRSPITNETVRKELKQRKEEINPVETKSEAPFPETEIFMINNAGLVILHPFLFAYFSRLGMVEGKAFKNDALQRRAVHLLQYVTGSTDQVTENELLLNKILVGLPPEEPVDESIILTEAEKEMSEQLLKVVTQQWDKLKNTSLGVLQTTFLQHKGSISVKEGNWNLQVEAGPYDMLLQTLPWGIGLIKLPWMNTMLYVLWEAN